MATIAALARAGGVGVETVRFYQRRGLMDRPVPAGGSKVARYGAGHAARLAFIRSAKSAGFTLDEIGELLRLDAGGDRQRVRDLARNRIAALNARINELSRARDALGRLARDCQSSDAGPCPIIAAFESED